MPVEIERPAVVTVDRKVSIRDAVLALVAAAGLAVAVVSRFGCAATEEQVGAAVRSHADTIHPASLERLHALETAASVNSAQHESIMQQLKTIDTKLDKALSGKATP